MAAWMFRDHDTGDSDGDRVPVKGLRRRRTSRKVRRAAYQPHPATTPFDILNAVPSVAPALARFLGVRDISAAEVQEPGTPPSAVIDTTELTSLPAGGDTRSSPANASPHLPIALTLHNGQEIRTTVSISRTGGLIVEGVYGQHQAPINLDGANSLGHERALMPALTETLGYLVGWAKGYPSGSALYIERDGVLEPTAVGYGHLARAALEGELLGWHALPKPRREPRKLRKTRSLRKECRAHLHRVIDESGMRARRKTLWSRALPDAVRRQRTAMFWHVPALEHAVALHGRRWGRYQPLADRETGTVPGAAARGLVPGLANLPGVFLTRDLAQRWRLLMATVSGLPMQLWSTIFASAKWGRKERDTAAAKHRIKPDFLDNGAGTAVGMAIDAGLRLAASQAQGEAPAALMAEIAGRRVTTGIAAAASEIRAYSPNMLAKLTYNRALEIAGRGEPANMIADLQTQSRRLHLALDAFLRTHGAHLTNQQLSDVAECLDRNNQLLFSAVKARDKAGLTLARLRTDAAPRGTPKIKNLVRTLMIPPLASTAVSATAAAVLGAPAFALLGLPAIAMTVGTLLTMRKYQSAITDQQADSTSQQDAQQTDDDTPLRQEVRGLVERLQKNANDETTDSKKSGPPFTANTRLIDEYKSPRALKPRLWSRIRHFRTWPDVLSAARKSPPLRQALQIMPFTGGAAAIPSLLAIAWPPLQPLQSLALSWTASSTLGPLANAGYAQLNSNMQDKERAEAADIDERTAARELFLHNENPQSPAAAIQSYIDLGAALNNQLGDVITHIENAPNRPAWVEPDSRLAEICDAVNNRGSAILTHRFVAALHKTHGDANAVDAFLTDLAGGKHRKAADIAVAFDERHETDLEKAAETEILGECMAEYQPEHLHLKNLFPPAPAPIDYLHKSAEQPSMRNDKFVAATGAIADSPSAHHENGRLNVDARRLSLCTVVAAELEGAVSARETSTPVVDIPRLIAGLPRADEQISHDIDRVIRARFRRTGRPQHSRIKPSRRRKTQAHYEKVATRRSSARAFRDHIADGLQARPNHRRNR